MTITLFTSFNLPAPPPASAQFHGAWLPTPGTLTLRSTLSRSVNDAWFCGDNRRHCTPGDRAVLSDLTARERAGTTSLIGSAGFGIFPGLAVGVELPWHDLDYARGIESRPEPVESFDARGIGDVQLAVRFGTMRGAWSLAAGYSLELPTGDFTINAFVIPVGQGSAGHTFSVEIGRSLDPAWLEAGFAYRIREDYVTEDDVHVLWGDEQTGRISGGRRTGPLLLKLEARVQRSGPFRTSIPGDPPGQARSSFELAPGVDWTRGSFALGIWSRLPLAGRNTPADPVLGLQLQWSGPIRGASEAGDGTVD